jgi:mannosyltransferase OCH1-like enzyme
MKIKILSGRDLLPRISRENHQNYCNKFNYEYIFETKSENKLLFKWSQKVYWIINNLKDCDYLFYLDDDTFFIRDTSLEDFIIESDYKDIIISKDWDNVNNKIFESPCSGVILFKNSDFCKDFLKEWLNPNYDEIYSNYKKEWLNIKEKGWLGDFNNDQDIFVYLSFKYFDHVKLWNHEKIGVFPHNIKDDTFLVHAPGLLANRAYIEGFKKINFDIKSQVYKWAGGNLALPDSFNKKEKLSIIIPVKDPPSELLKKCIFSVKNISYKNFECLIICCNNLKKDEIISYINNDNRFKYYNSNIENTHYQRIQGIEESSGKYIACLDSDDFVDTTFYEEVISNIERDDADMSYVYCLTYDLSKNFVSSTPTKRAGFSIVWKKMLFEQAREYFYKLPHVNHGEDSFELNIIKHFSKKIVDTITIGKYGYIIGIPTNSSYSLNKSSFLVKKRIWSQFIEKNLLTSLGIQYNNEEFSSQDVLNTLPYYKQLTENEKQDIKSFILDPPEYTNIFELTEENIEEKMFSKYKEKFVHWIWLSNDTISDNIKNCIRSWNILYNNGWKIKKWNFDNLPKEINNSFVQSAIQKNKYAFASDYIRLWILYNFGGIYLDSDCICLKPFDEELLERDLLLGYEDGNYIAGHFMGAKSRHPLIKKCLDWYDDKIFDESWLKQGPEPIQKNMPYTLPGLLTNLLKNEKIYIYPKDYFTAKNYATKEKYITENTYILHQYAASWLKDNSKKEFQINDFGFKN